MIFSAPRQEQNIARYSLYPSLEVLPNVSVDEYGNLRFREEPRDSLRRRFELVAALPAASLAGTVLAELLNWLRWGSETGVMWEATLSELANLVRVWEEANLPTDPQNYFGRDSEEIPFEDPEAWEDLWNTQGFRYGIVLQRVCACGRTFRDLEVQCPNCEKYRYQDGTRDAWVGPRGAYNIALVGGDGWAVAQAAYQTLPMFRIVDEKKLPLSR